MAAGLTEIGATAVVIAAMVSALLIRLGRRESGNHQAEGLLVWACSHATMEECE